MAIAGVVAAVDGSTPAEDALVWASREAAMRRRPLYAVNVYDTFEDPANASARAGFQSISEMTGTIIQDLTPRMTAAVRRSGQADAGVTVDVLYGHPVETLLELAGTDQLLVTGSRALGPFKGCSWGPSAKRSRSMLAARLWSSRAEATRWAGGWSLGWTDHHRRWPLYVSRLKRPDCDKPGWWWRMHGGTRPYAPITDAPSRPQHGGEKKRKPRCAIACAKGLPACTG